jgi:hypothetical protein
VSLKQSSGAKRQKREKEQTPGRQLPDFLWKGTPLQTITRIIIIIIKI